MPAPGKPDGFTPLDDRVRWLIGPVLVVLAAWLYGTRARFEAPHAPAPPISRAQISTAPLRTPLGDPPWILAGGYRLRCMECHGIKPPPAREQRPLMQHRDIVLDHGINDRCLNCHHPVDRNRLTLVTGEAIPFADAPRLCAGCHGTTYRDWQRRTHGKTLGYWDATRGEPRQLSCIECHDPHAPAFKPMHPLPPPETLRMGTPHEAEHREQQRRHNPLRQWETG